MTVKPHNYSIVMATPLPGNLRLGVAVEQQGITRMDFLPADTPLRQGCSSLERRIEATLMDYFYTPGADTDIPLHPEGTSYQQRVWKAMRKIPVGSTTSYGVLAGKIASAPRAVAAACRSNPIPILIPCHRVVAKNGLGGYMGATTGEAVEIKRWLLDHENAFR